MDSLTQELRAKYNPDGSLLRQEQLRMMELLDEIDRICKKYDIPYWLSSGTLLGAVRHQGFIPWDDDLDVEMFEEDYDRLLKVLPHELPEHLALQCHETDPNYFYPFAKLRDRNSYLEEFCIYDRYFKEQGIFVDIFPLVKIPKWVGWISGHLHGQIYNQFNNPKLNDETRLRRARWIWNFNRAVSFPMLRLISKLCWKCGWRNTLGTSYLRPRDKKDILPLTEMVFEGKRYPVPHDADAMLRKLYGDYLKLPDLNNLHPHCSTLKIFK